jgi:hypothetical protein
MDPDAPDPLLGAGSFALVLEPLVELPRGVRGEEEARVAFFGRDGNTKFVEARAAAVGDVVQIYE